MTNIKLLCALCHGVGTILVPYIIARDENGNIIERRTETCPQCTEGYVEYADAAILTDILNYCEWIKEKLEQMGEGKPK